MFQPWFTDIISLSSDILVGISAIIVGCIGIIGLKQWKAELTGRSKFEIARKVSVLVVQFREKFHKSRSRDFIMTDPGKYYDENGESDDAWFTLAEYSNQSKKVQTLRDILDKLYETNWELEVLTGINLNKYFTDLEEYYHDLYFSVQTYYEIEIKRKRSGIPSIEHYISSDDYENENFEIQGYRMAFAKKDDEISKSINNLTNQMLDALKSFVNI